MRFNFGTDRKTDTTLPPFVVAGDDVIGHENNVGGVSDQLVLVGVGFWGDEREHGIAVRRSDRDPAFAGLDTSVEYYAEAQLVAIELETRLLVAYEHIDAVQPEKRIGRQLRHRVHGRNYKKSGSVESV